LPTLPYHSNSSIKRLWSHERFARTLTQALNAALADGTAPDALYVNLPAPVVAAAVGKIRQRIGCRMVLDIRDSWPDNFLQILPAALGMRFWLWPRLLRPFREQAKRAIAAADCVTAVSADYLEIMERYGLPRGSGHVHYIGANPELLASGPPNMQTRFAEANSPLRLVYIGGFGASYDLHTLGQAMTKLSDPTSNKFSPLVELHLAGYGAPPVWAKQLRNVTAHGMLPPPPTATTA
jgi:hypothetical protein